MNKDKIVATYFSRKHTIPQNCVQLKNNKIPWSKSAKYLGVILDNKLTFKKHLENNEQKAKKLTGHLYPLINCNSNLNVENKIRIIKAIYIPALTYGCESWSITKEHLTKTVSGKINKMLRMALNAPWYITNKQIQEETKTEDMTTIIRKKSVNLLEKIDTHEDTPISRLIENRPIKPTDVRKSVINLMKISREQMQ